VPGLPLAEHFSNVQFVLCDSVQKKLKALEEVSASLKNVEFLWGRFEELVEEERGQFDLVMARAVAPLPILLEYAAGFLREGGYLLAWKGPGAEEELQASHKAQELLGLRFERQHDYTLPTGESRSILVFVQQFDCPPAYPRGVGIPSKKPL
jgi:16S rRNA (guanine527-N7)-methyltransferase